MNGNREHLNRKNIISALLHFLYSNLLNPALHTLSGNSVASDFRSECYQLNSLGEILKRFSRLILKVHVTKSLNLKQVVLCELSASSETTQIKQVLIIAPC